MDFNGIIISGTEGSGKSSAVHELIDNYNYYKRVIAITTRNKYKRDLPHEYKYVDKKSFDELDKKNKLYVKDIYRSGCYAIEKKELNKIIKENKIPILVLTPKTVFKYPKITKKYMTIFIDAPDNELEKRLSKRKINNNEAIKRRKKDRSYKENYQYILNNSELKTTCYVINYLWKYRNTGGILSKNIIQNLINCDLLIQNPKLSNIKGASYDLRLGDEFYSSGKINKLSDKNPFLKIEPYDYAVVTSKETVNFPPDVSGYFDLSVSLFYQGIILSNGPQVDPGFRGKLFCLLFNTSDSLVLIKRNQHYATLVFNKLLEPTEPYRGKYQNKEKIIDYLPEKTMMGAINELKKELEMVKQESKRLQNFFFMIMSIILSIIALLLTIR